MTQQRTDTKVVGIRLEQRVLLRLGGFARTKGSRGGFLASSGFALGWSLRRSERLSLFFKREGEDDRASEL